MTTTISYDGPDAAEQEAIDVAIEKANAGVDWAALEAELGDLDGLRIAFRIADARTLVGFVIRSRRLIKITSEIDIKAASHVVTTDKSTFWAVATKSTTIDRAYFTWGSVNVEGENPHIVARVLKRIFDKVYEVI